MTFEIMGRGFENGPTERYEFDVPLHPTQGPSWSTDILKEIGPKFFQSVPRCRSMHPDHDCQCTSQEDHRGGWGSKHHCWHGQAWQAWHRAKLDLEKVPSKRNLAARSPVLINTSTGEFHIEQAHIRDELCVKNTDT